MTFGIIPTAGFPPPTADDFPDYIQFQGDGINAGARDADTVNFVGATVTRGEGESAGTVTVEIEGGSSAPSFSWVEVPSGDYTLSLSDNLKGISTSSDGGDPQTVWVPEDTGDATVDFPDGATVLIYQEGSAQTLVNVLGSAGVAFRDVFNSASAGQSATLTLIKLRTNSWLLCGDLALL